jgi:hypothetical protein
MAVELCAVRADSLYFMLIPMGEIDLDFARSSGTQPLRKTRPPSTEVLSKS